MLAVEHLRVLAEDVAVLVNLHQRLSDEFLVDRAFGSRVIVKTRVPLPEQLGYSGVVPVSQLFRRDSFFYRLNFDWRAMLIRPAHHEHVLAPEPVVPCSNVC